MPTFFGVFMRNFFLDALEMLGACWQAQLVLTGGSIVSIVLSLMGADLAANISPSRWAFHEQIQVGAACAMFILAIFALVASCALAYNACQRYIEKHT